MGDDAPTDGIGIKFIQYLGFGGILIGLSVFQIEFDFGVPQFRQVFQPMLIAAAAAFGLVAARIMLGRGAAVIAALLAIVLRGLVALIVGPILGRTDQLVRAVSRTRDRRRIARPDATVQAAHHLRCRQRPGGRDHRTLAGVVVDRRGLPLPVADQHVAGSARDGHSRRRPHRCLRRDVRPGPHLTAAAVPCDQHRPGGADGAGHRWRDGQRTALPRAAERHGHNHSRRCARRAARVSGWWMPMCGSTRRTLSATTPTGCRSSRGRAIWRISAGRSSTNLEKVGPGHYRSTEAVPVWGTWKTLLRVHDGKTLTAVPIYLAADPGIGAKEVPAEASFTRPFVAEITILQRERNPDTPRCCGWSAAWWCWSARWFSSAASAGARAGSTAASPLAARPNFSPRRRRDRSTPDIEILAHHGLLLAIPAFAPAIAVAGVVIYVALRDRRREGEAPQGENSDSPRQDGSP